MNYLALSSLFLVPDGVFISVTVVLGVLLVALAVGGFFVGGILKKRQIDKRLGEVEK